MIASKIVVLPEPVSPVIRKSPSLPLSNSIVTLSAYEPNADIVSLIGLILIPSSLPA